MQKNEIAFGGEVQPAQCECHKGQFVLYILHFHPSIGTVCVGNEMFPTEEAANAAMTESVMKHARRILGDAGLKVEEAKEVKIRHGDEAEQEINRVLMQHRNENPNLH